ncbi:hypothetical protein PP358_gp27 [Arthrobacter phage Shoya]|uniref:Uncharacterized protein n=1 Tax=Arthrobacter phage Shoya TaxID=2704035 RepID=A0A6G6XHX7_9CAUD|nr:hypothetical protein PP358_gp27 [Arthrobacter phage Shoya]QIG57698.1 hypothetical protein SEA_SHOYA_27 [Arthrobacter phage Shoya]
MHNSLTNIQLHGASTDVYFSGTSVPTALLFCNRCGLVSMHALGQLGLLQHPAFGYGSAVNG